MCNRHLQTHTDNHINAPSVRKASARKDLILYTRVHTLRVGDHLYQCAECQKCFSQTGKHTGERPERTSVRKRIRIDENINDAQNMEEGSSESRTSHRREFSGEKPLQSVSSIRERKFYKLS